MMPSWRHDERTNPIDTGIYAAHPDFEWRALFFANFASDGMNNDGHDHGTYIAGTVGSKTSGVAKKTKFYGSKVLSNSGSRTTSAVIAGISFPVNDLERKKWPTRLIFYTTIRERSQGFSPEPYSSHRMTYRR
ncbi:peptidase S8/S53 domain-containing protein [Boeremia exigua]|uniref:peptidase S8/S53 domain-containing protein n=1 Tax=Boeremia exigua TaxID=749465 RepID=UPI001E8E57BF|nr:peptidase S8/S53 domain-containing protein [Boeremia exigua]KAH6614349.1 peptidase S8/S53 domain-containing protein [Boeremia exigua]